jgi:hypothetical protein
MHMTMASECALLTPEDEAGFAQVLAIYQAAIVASEQKTPAELGEMMRNPRYRVIVTRVGGEVIAFAILFLPTSGSFWLLEYMAVDAHRRSSGEGERIFAAAKALASEIAPGAPCVLEVDQPQSRSLIEEATRRLRFYRRLGCRRIDDLEYILPLDKAGAPPPMWLLVDGLEGRDTLGAEEVAQWVRAIYVEVYGRQPDDARLFTMLSQADGLKERRLLNEF